MRLWYVVVALGALYFVRQAVAKSYIGPDGTISEFQPWSGGALPSPWLQPGGAIVEFPTITPEQRAAIERGGRGGLI